MTASGQLAVFAYDLKMDHVPEAAIERAKDAFLDSIGVALAAGDYAFATKAASAAEALSGGGEFPVIGSRVRLSLRESALLNGILIHGLDFDDTHLKSAIHPSASLVPTILAVAYRQGSCGSSLLEAYIAGLEAMARLGQYGGMRLRDKGFHPTSVIGVFGCALAAGKLLELDPEQLAMAQGIALSMASGSVGSAADGASNKRLHAGWAAQAGITAAMLAQSGIRGPDRPYDGKRGLFRHIGAAEDEIAEGLAAELGSLGTVWETANISAKPIPACHFTHACSDAAVRLRAGVGFEIADIRHITALVPAGVVQAVCEPLDLKRKPADAYAAQFSIPFVVAASLVRGRFGLAELDAAALTDPQILKLAGRVDYAIDPDSTYPVHRTGEIRIELADGSIVRHREAVNRGAPDRPLSRAEIASKFQDNALRGASPHRVAGIADAVRDMELALDGRGLVGRLCGNVCIA